MTKKSKEKTYEEAFAEIENLVQILEQGDISLDESLNHFEKAVKLIDYCKGILTDAEQRLTILKEADSGEIIEEQLSFEVGTNGEN